MLFLYLTVNPFRVTFKKGILKQDAQKYSLPKNESLTIDVWYPQPVSSAQVAISGPSTIPNCGVFTLVGHFSSPKGDAQFYWTANRADKRPLEVEIANALLMIRTASLTLDSSLLEVEQEYIFILTAEHPINEKYEARHVVSRKPYIGPLVTAYSNVMTQSSVMVDETVTLQADLTLPECSNGKENMYLMWSVNNPKVKFNFRNRRSSVYVIEPYSLPENTEVVFIANAFFSNMLNITESKIHLRVEPMKLKAAIKGTAKRVVGNKAGNLVLESENLNAGIPVIYQWKCYDKNYPICYNYKKNSTEALLVPRKLQSKPKLVIPCESLKAGHVLTFELRVFNANNRFHSQTASVMVLVESKNIPQVIIDSVIADGSIPIQRHPTTGAYSIPAGLPVAVHATINAVKTTLKSVKWEVKGYSSSFTFTTMHGKSVLSLEEGFLVGHGIYLIGLSACDGMGACGIANLTIHAIPGVALCKLEVQPYVEYEMIKPVVSGCSIPPGRQPLTYQIFLHSIESVFPITPPQTPTVFNMFGPPRQTANGTQMSVQVCDKYLLCTLFAGSTVRVSSSERREEDRDKLIKKAEHAMEIDDPLTTLSLYLIAASDKEVALSQVETENMLSAGAKATVNRYISAGQLSLVYSAMRPLVRQNSDKVKMRAITVIKRGTKLAFGNKIKIPAEVLSRGHTNVAEALQCRDAGSAVSDAVKNTLDYFVERLSASVPLGTRVLMSSKYPGYPTSLVFRQHPDRSPIYIKAMSSDGTVEGSVRFEDAIRDKVRKRKCAKTCKEGIVVALTLYPASAPYPTTDRRTSPVLDITLREPEGGKPLSMADVPNAIRLALSHSGNYSESVSNRILYRCSYWDAANGEWSSEGLVTFGVDGNVMRCWSSHLTSFAVMEIYDGLSTGSIVGIVVTVLMGVFIIMMLAFFFFRKKQAANARVSNEALQSKRSSEKMNGSMRVKTVTP
ncbi:uncharacterized protein LOC129217760 [Uloborus diversus]|uniref:uncharacterized protein LOC129217760 n=1 Tax=Uloborus diversus TaxID=327109 RepID=UPI002409E195|nr:uncharacterized protein LOC129217760 [Uloborus diversus]